MKALKRRGERELFSYLQHDFLHEMRQQSQTHKGSYVLRDDVKNKHLQARLSLQDPQQQVAQRWVVRNKLDYVDPAQKLRKLYSGVVARMSLFEKRCFNEKELLIILDICVVLLLPRFCSWWTEKPIEISSFYCTDCVASRRQRSSRCCLDRGADGRSRWCIERYSTWALEVALPCVISLH